MPSEIITFYSQVSGSVCRLFHGLSLFGAIIFVSGPIPFIFGSVHLQTLQRKYFCVLWYISTFHDVFRAFSLSSTHFNLQYSANKNHFFQNTKPKISKHFFLFSFPESASEYGHFAPKIIKNGSRSSENEAIEVSKYRHAWIFLVLLFRC